MLVKLFKFFLSQGIFGLFFLMFLEGNPLVGSFVPGQIVLFTAGVLVSLGYFSLKEIIIASIAGSFIGDIFNFALGRVFFTKVNITTNIVSKTSKLVKKNSIKVVVLGKLFNVTRAFTPYLCGKSKMEFWKFAIANFAVTFFWCVLSVVVGYKFGSLIFSGYSLMTKILIILICLLVLMHFSSLVLHRIYRIKIVKEYFLFNYIIISALLFSLLFINKFQITNIYHFHFLNIIRIPLSIIIILVPPIYYIFKDRKKFVLFFINSIFYVIYVVLFSIFLKYNHLILPYSSMLLVEYSFFYLYNVFRTCSVYSFFIFFFANLFVVITYILAGFDISRTITSIVLAGIYIELLIIFTQTWLRSLNTLYE